MDIEFLLDIDGGDFSLWQSKKDGRRYYHISIEGYIGLDYIKDFIPLYEKYLRELHTYLTKANQPKREHVGWYRLFRSRAFEICYEADSYWIFLEEYKSEDIWETYYYLEDVIEQLEKLKL